MNGLQTNNAPHSSVVIPHFIFGGLSFLTLAVLIILANTNVLEAYFNSKIIAITHMAVLGWATMIVFGALYQLIPVVFETSLYSEKLAKFTFWISAFSVIYLTFSFWVGAFTTHLVYASACMFFSLFLFITNVILSYKKSEIKNISSKFIDSMMTNTTMLLFDHVNFLLVSILSELYLNDPILNISVLSYLS